MEINKRNESELSRGVFTRCIGKENKKSIITERYSQSAYKANPQVLIEGNILSYHAPNSFSLYGGDTNELINFQVVSSVQKSIVITILLEGKLNFSYDDLLFDLNAHEQQTALMVNLTKPVSFRRNIYQNNHVVKLHILVPLDWIESRCESNDHIQHFISQHLANLQLNLSAKVISLSKQIIDLHSPSCFIEKMEVETLTNTLLLEFFKQLSSPSATNLMDLHSDRLNYSTFDKTLDNLMIYIEEHLDSSISMSELVEMSAMSLSSLQRKFKRATGCSINNYIRLRRLKIAKQHLEQGLSSITQLAYNAGYRHPSNFTNAFKKAFGFTPQELVNRKNDE